MLLIDRVEKSGLMADLITLILLSQWTVLGILGGSFLVLSRWVLFGQRAYKGYALGVLLALFFLVVYAALGGGTVLDADVTLADLSFVTVILTTIIGLAAGAGTLFALYVGRRYARGFSLQVAVYTALNLILFFVVVIDRPTARIIGIFALAFAIATLFGLVLYQPDAPASAQRPEPQTQTQTLPVVDAPASNGDAAAYNSKRATSRLQKIRQDLADRDQRR
jgi:uncharacterized membrane protein YsdA (DUF1294 family)